MDPMANEPQDQSEQPFQQVSQELAELADHVFETHAEQPAEQVRAALEQQARERDIELSDEMLERLSTEISSGNRVEIGPI
jgi:5-hydroxyisourate hydrolase-like protein (transthyretin family)